MVKFGVRQHEEMRKVPAQQGISLAKMRQPLISAAKMGMAHNLGGTSGFLLAPGTLLHHLQIGISPTRTCWTAGSGRLSDQDASTGPCTLEVQAVKGRKETLFGSKEQKGK